MHRCCVSLRYSMIHVKSFTIQDLSVTSSMTSIFSAIMTILPSLASMGSFEGMSSSTSPNCRCFPGDSCWPSLYDWQTLNSSVDGMLIASVPVAAVCHEFHSSDTPVSIYNNVECQEERDNWFSPEFHFTIIFVSNEGSYIHEQ
jgi:hypothetical protein